MTVEIIKYSHCMCTVYVSIGNVSSGKQLNYEHKSNNREESKHYFVCLLKNATAVELDDNQT